jgi:hypothetical protein
MLGLGRWIAEKWTPGTLYLDEWASLLDLSVFILVAIVLTIFLVYRFWFYRWWKVSSWRAISRPRYTWFVAISSVSFLHVLGIMLVSFSILTGYSLSAFVGTLFVSLLEGLCGMVLFLLLSLVSYPSRGKYFPFLSYRIRRSKG